MDWKDLNKKAHQEVQKDEDSGKLGKARAVAGLLCAVPAAQAIGYCFGHDILSPVGKFLALILLWDWVVFCIACWDGRVRINRK